MNLKALRLFHNVVKLGSLASAADALYISSPAASRLLVLLEEELEVTLLDRSRRRLQLTEAGRNFFQSAEPILEGIDKLPRIAKEASKVSDRQLKVLTSTPLGVSWVSPAIKGLREETPEISIQIDIKSRFEMAAKLGERVDEIGIASLPIEHALFNLHLTPLISCDQQVMVPKGHPLAQKPYLEARDIQEYTLILLKESQVGRSAVNHLFTEKGIILDKYIEVTSSVVAMSLCQNNVGITITNALFAQLAPQFDCVSMPLLPKQKIVFGYILPDREGSMKQLSLTQKPLIDHMLRHVHSLESSGIEVLYDPT